LLCLAIADGIYLYGIKSDELLGVVRRFWSRRRSRLRGRDDQNRYQDYRTICEGLRVQLYWRIAGMRALVANDYLPRQKNQLEWIRSAVRAWGLLAEPAAPRGGSERMSNKQQALILNRWIIAQLNFYMAASYRDGVLHLAFRQTAGGFLVASLTTSFLVALY